MNDWSTFFAATAGAAATLAGLIFVAVSINLSRILESALLPLRALEGLASLIAILFVALVALVPGQADSSVGAEIAVIAALEWAFQVWAVVSTHREGRAYPRYWLRYLCCLLPAPPMIVAGGMVAMHRGADAAPWLLVGVLLSFSAALISAWVLLIEIKR